MEADGTACSYRGVTDGICVDGVCFPAGCGNGELEEALQEVCDDGNQLHGDGCSADCRSEETCGNGVIDAVNQEACDDGNNIDGDGCQADCLLADCLLATCGDGVVDSSLFEDCDAQDGNSLEPNAACRPDCRLRRCGDSIIDTADGEVCDDGNLLSGDGCSGDCESDETCGNDYVDAGEGELCDDGNRANHDGCDSKCRPETASWLHVANAEPPARLGGAMVYDGRWQRLVLFGGSGDLGQLGDTWEWDGRRWTQQFPITSPPARVAHAMAYDSGRGVTVLYGGYVFTGLYRRRSLNDTWEYNGVDWHRVSPATRPSHRL